MQQDSYFFQCKK